ncbi:TNF receptor-associated factor 4-like [Actinia tenebrosa]|uniref:TNF receptor-associated factor 4-like n=1 Tax=Actinia tenebrosa TaxID=6105 RepID=A0A6P8HBI8_ACTTE|nr:TNF receptor-associated factor 4-like [Actinia tenebrosa]
MMPREDMAKHLLQECEWREIPCPHCDQMTGFCQLKAHEKICEQVTVECTNAECDVMKPRMEMTKHLEQECEWRQVSCPHCNDDHHAFKLQDHIKVCPKTPVRCPNECGVETINEEIADHVTNECPLTEVPCIYQQFGCQFLMQRKENRMEEHMEKATKDHLALACEELKLLQENNGVLSNRVSSLQDENESMFHRLFLLQEESMSKFDRLFSRLSSVEDRNAFLSGRLSDVQNENAAMSHRLLHQDEIKKPNKKTVKKEEKKKEEPSIPYTGTFVWKIGNVKKLLSEAKQGRSTVLFSEPFYTANHGYKLRAMLYPNGAKNENAGHMSIYAQIKRGEYDDTLPWPFGKDITFTLVDQKINIKNRKNIKDTIHSKNLLDSFLQCFQRPTSDTNKSIPGLSTFVKHDKLMSKSYAKGDSMVIIVDVSEATT